VCGVKGFSDETEFIHVGHSGDKWCINAGKAKGGVVTVNVGKRVMGRVLQTENFEEHACCGAVNS